MSENIIVALIGLAGTIIAATIGSIRANKYKHESCPF